ncbi:hypothetical protein LOD99_10568 [Oopsacas minuta]|uniref:Uncharacterized protein n=1 Tax=Oopsacas minuta TaxID=111878 RepID=A0AAV7KIX8_9METZ|nr:hypothetical protein LOD99_10568 [Oopsacas minuta]
MNTYVLARFGDEDCPEVISESMKSNFPFDENRFFAFNNADLFKSESERRSDPKQYWDITINSIIRFYNTLAHQLPFEITTETRKAIEDRVNLQMTTNARTSLNLKKLEAVKGPTKKITTYCTVCKCICHKNCNQPCSDKRRCWAMMTNGYCRICPNRCKWNLHECGPDM